MGTSILPPEGVVLETIPAVAARFAVSYFEAKSRFLLEPGTICQISMPPYLQTAVIYDVPFCVWYLDASGIPLHPTPIDLLTLEFTPLSGERSRLSITKMYGPINESIELHVLSFWIAIEQAYGSGVRPQEAQRPASPTIDQRPPTLEERVLELYAQNLKPKNISDIVSSEFPDETRDITNTGISKLLHRLKNKKGKK